MEYEWGIERGLKGVRGLIKGRIFVRVILDSLCDVGRFDRTFGVGEVSL